MTFQPFLINNLEKFLRLKSFGPDFYTDEMTFKGKTFRIIANYLMIKLQRLKSPSLSNQINQYRTIFYGFIG